LNSMSRHTVLLLLFTSAALGVQQPVSKTTTAAEAPTRDTSYIRRPAAQHQLRLGTDGLRHRDNPRRAPCPVSLCAGRLVGPPGPAVVRPVRQSAKSSG